MFVQLFRIVFGQIENINKVNMCLARYSPRATTTNQPTNRALNEPARPGAKLTKMPILGQIWSFLGRKSEGKIKRFVTYITKNPPRHLVRIGFWSGMGGNGTKMPIFGPKLSQMHN